LEVFQFAGSSLRGAEMLARIFSFCCESLAESLSSGKTAAIGGPSEKRVQD
jgi:hypothetical protein